ncbi:MAG TPA: nucleoside deaminase [Saprospiraceae bacterium]|nr:nucleoside deaminase [Saprospiraceae bacterium]
MSGILPAGVLRAHYSFGALHQALQPPHAFLALAQATEVLQNLKKFLILATSYNKMIQIFSDQYFMKIALQQALQAQEAGEVPIGAVLVHGKTILAKTYNQTELLTDVTAHAEILAITAAANQLNSKYLKECTLYVSLEPCIMCAGALHWSQIGKLVYAAEDPKQGFMRYGKELLHPKTKLQYGLMADEAGMLLKEFFARRRK